MHKYIAADWLFPVSTAPIENGVLGVAASGEITHVLTKTQAASQGIENITYYPGALIPGFVNTHCHLELSHLKGLISEHTGLPGFIKQILAQRQQPDEAILSAMQKADDEMHENGIVAVGDISNLLISKSVKQKSKIYYHTFVEVFGFNRPSAPVIAAGLELKKDFAPLISSVVPHAPYSVSSALFKEINKITQGDDILSIHNQETTGENELFESGTGTFAQFLSDLGIAQSEAHNQGRNSLQYHLPQLPKAANVLLVHNTFTSKADVTFAKTAHQKLYWCLCPNANLYIENSLPDLDVFTSAGVEITLGTDSLASNHQLNILAEMRTLQVQKGIPFEKLLTWATLNGAAFLKIQQQFGSLETCKAPGILNINLGENREIANDTVIKRLF